MLNTDSLNINLVTKTKSALRKQIWVFSFVNVILIILVVILFINQQKEFNQKNQECILKYQNNFKESVIKYNGNINKCVEYIEIQNISQYE